MAVLHANGKKGQLRSNRGARFVTEYTEFKCIYKVDSITKFRQCIYFNKNRCKIAKVQKVQKNTYCMLKLMRNSFVFQEQNLRLTFMILKENAE